MISHKYQLIFLHIPKCAGTSIENALGHYDNHTAGRGGQDHRSLRMIEQPVLTPYAVRNIENIKELVRRYRNPRETIYNENNRLTLTRKQYRKYYKFTIVRNPWARAFSWYRNVMKDPVHLKNYGLSADTTFPVFLKRYAGLGMLQPQTYWLRNFRGDIPLDHIGRFENLAAEFSHVSSQIGLDGLELPHKIKGPSADYRAHYDQEAIERVSRVYCEEIDLFGYSFDSNSNR